MGYFSIQPQVRSYRNGKEAKNIDLDATEYTSDTHYEYVGDLGTTGITLDPDEGLTDDRWLVVYVHNLASKSHGGIVTVDFGATFNYVLDPGIVLFVSDVSNANDLVISSDTEGTPVRIWVGGDKS